MIVVLAVRWESRQRESGGRKGGGEVKGYQSAVRKYCRPAELWAFCWAVTDGASIVLCVGKAAAVALRKTKRFEKGLGPSEGEWWGRGRDSKTQSDDLYK